MSKTLDNRSPHIHIGLFVSAFLALTLTSTLSFAKPQDVTEAELKLLPRYCLDTQWFPDRYQTRATHWKNIMGKSFNAMHHYCWGLTNMNRARKASAKHKTGLLEDVLNDFWYVIQQSPSEFVLLPEIYTRIGEVELMIKHPNKANDAFSKARNLKPDYWPAYTHWIEFLMQTRKRAEALELARSGLMYVPDARVLREQYRLLGGNPAEIPPRSLHTPPSNNSPDPNQINR